jgi:hypothetical protein
LLASLPLIRDDSLIVEQTIQTIDTRQKALEINLDNTKYGVFAEIGAGQEVARWFFRVGGAAGTIAKSMSAYDMVFSDAIYGPSVRYVSRQRVEQMLDHEYQLMIERLDATRGATTRFFVFANSVSARNYKGTNECHGWIGFRFQTAPRSAPSDILLHLRLLDKENWPQQEALGIVGVNLIYGALHHHADTDLVLRSLLDSLTAERLDIDLIHFRGPAFKNVDNRLMSMKLVQLDLSDAAMFASNGEVLQPSEVLYKKPILVERGSFRPFTNVHLGMLERSLDTFHKDPTSEGEEPVILFELTMRNLMQTGAIDYEDFLERADVIAPTGHHVLISDYFRYYRLAAYLSTFTKKMIGMTMGAGTLRELFNEEFYTDLAGGILESFGRLFKNNTKLLVYPWIDPATNELRSVENLNIPAHLNHLYRHFLDHHTIVPIEGADIKQLGIRSADVMQMIQSGNPEWEAKVPPAVAGVIKERGFFGYERTSS